MRVAVIQECIDPYFQRKSPWYHHQRRLAEAGIDLEVFSGDSERAFETRFDAMLTHVWLDWDHPWRFRANRILPLMARRAAYRARFPETVQIVVNDTDMSTRAYAAPYWVPGDPVLFRAPAYDRGLLAPFPARDIWPYELVMGSARFRKPARPFLRAGFIGLASGSGGRRRAVAANVRKVGLGLCLGRRLPARLYDAVLSHSRIVVCPQGWGGGSQRHWDAWFSGKPVLTDAACAAVEMIPGVRLQRNVHFLVYDAPSDIPDIVSDWTRPGRLDDLEQMALNGRRAAESHDSFANVLGFFESVRARAGAAGAAR